MSNLSHLALHQILVFVRKSMPAFQALSVLINIEKYNSCVDYFNYILNRLLLFYQFGSTLCFIDFYGFKWMIIKVNLTR